MKLIYIILVSLLAAVSLAAAYTPEQQNMIDGTQLSWKLATAYATKDTPTFNTLVDQWNAWVAKNFGQDPNMIMAKMTAPLDLTKPTVIRNNTTSGGIVHAIDGMSKANNMTVKTNDANLLTQAELEANRRANPGQGEGFLPAP
jgi:alpha-L-arabinofuranosidase